MKTNTCHKFLTLLLLMLIVLETTEQVPLCAMSQGYVLKVQKTLEDNRTVYRVLLILVWHFIKEIEYGYLYMHT